MAEQEEKSEQLRKDYMEVFKSEAGQRVFEDLKQVCFFYDTTIHQIPHIMAHQEGLRTVILHIDGKLKLTAIKLKELQDARGQSESEEGQLSP